MIVVSDTSPLNYLVLIGADQVLPSLFGRVLTPPEVLAEMQHAKAPPQVQRLGQEPARLVGGSFAPGNSIVSRFRAR